MATTWIDLLRRQRVKMGEAKYGPFTKENFTQSGRDSMAEGIDELVDYLNYRFMSYKEGKISRRTWQRRKEIIGSLLHEDKTLLR